MNDPNDPLKSRVLIAHNNVLEESTLPALTTAPATLRTLPQLALVTLVISVINVTNSVKLSVPAKESALNRPLIPISACAVATMAILDQLAPLFALEEQTTLAATEECVMHWASVSALLAGESIQPTLFSHSFCSMLPWL